MTEFIVKNKTNTTMMTSNQPVMIIDQHHHQPQQHHSFPIIFEQPSSNIRTQVVATTNNNTDNNGQVFPSSSTYNNNEKTAPIESSSNYNTCFEDDELKPIGQANEEFTSSFIMEKSSLNNHHPLRPETLPHVFKFLSFRDHLQNSTLLVCKQWFESLIGMFHELHIDTASLSVAEYFQQLQPAFLQQPPSSPTSNNSTSSTGSSGTQSLSANSMLLRELFEENLMTEEIEKLSSLILFEQLRRVELEHLRDGFSFELIYYMIYNLKELNELKLSECTLLKGRLTKRIKAINANLEQPKTTKRKSIFSIFKRSKSTATTDAIVNTQDTLENKIESVREDYRRDTTLQRCIEEDVSATFSNITVLDLFKCKLNDEVYRFFIEKLANLRILKLIECTGLSSIDLTTESSELSHIEIDFETNPPSLTLDFNCKKLTDSLTYLSINRVHAFNFEKFMERCTQLKTLKIMSYFDEKFTKQMESIENLIIEPYCCANFDNIRSFLPNLSLLHLHNVKYDLGNIFPFFPKLKEVQVNFLHDDAVRSLNLEELTVLGDTSVECTLDCPNLKILKIQKINQKSFANNFEKLTHLDLSHSIQINDQILERFLQCTLNLKTLILSDCPNISLIKFSSQNYPHLKLISQ